jgi:hypothetical protein
MNARYPVLRISVFVIALFAGLSVTRAQTGGTADVVTAIPAGQCGGGSGLRRLFVRGCPEAALHHVVRIRGHGAVAP